MFSLIQKPHFYLSTYSFVFKDQISELIMDALKVNSCMCLDLKTGGLVIGCIQVISHCILFIYGFKFLTIPENIVIFGKHSKQNRIHSSYNWRQSIVTVVSLIKPHSSKH